MIYESLGEPHVSSGHVDRLLLLGCTKLAWERLPDTYIAALPKVPSQRSWVWSETGPCNSRMDHPTSGRWTWPTSNSDRHLLMFRYSIGPGASVHDAARWQVLPTKPALVSEETFPTSATKFVDMANKGRPFSFWSSILDFPNVQLSRMKMGTEEAAIKIDSNLGVYRDLWMAEHQRDALRAWRMRQDQLG